MSVTRRELMAGVAIGLVVQTLPPASGDGFRIEWQGGPQTAAVAASLAAQIALVVALRIKPEIAAFFAAQVITVDLAEDTRTRAGPRGVFFERRAMPPDNPVLLHELLHRYHLLRLPEGFRNARVIGYYNDAKAGGLFPSDAYMLTNPIEFFAMAASVVLYGHAARPPFRRDNVLAKLPDMYRWIVAEFGART